MVKVSWGKSTMWRQRREEKGGDRARTGRPTTVGEWSRKRKTHDAVKNNG